MKRILIVKTSSMGDIIHTFPAIHDALSHYPHLIIDWLVENSFQEVPRLHTGVQNVIPLNLRQWKKEPVKSLFSAQWKEDWQQLRQHTYDRVIDAQGLLKSAVLARCARGTSIGFAKKDIREKAAAYLYHSNCPPSTDPNIIFRIRHLFSYALNYPMPTTPINYGLSLQQFPRIFTLKKPYLVFLHGTTWPNKHYPEVYWQELAQQAVKKKFFVCLAWYTEEEHERAKRIAALHHNIKILPLLTIKQLTSIIATSKGVIGLDTGLGHLAVALNVPTLLLWGPSNANLSSANTANSIHLQADYPCAPCNKRFCIHPNSSNTPYPPCFTTLPPTVVWQRFQTLLKPS